MNIVGEYLSEPTVMFEICPLGLVYTEYAVLADL